MIASIISYAKNRTMVFVVNLDIILPRMLTTDAKLDVAIVHKTMHVFSV